MKFIDGGYRVAETDTHHIDVLGMLVNWRVVETPKADPSGYDRYWCYAGRSNTDLLRVVVAAVVWVEMGQDEPRGWTKSGQTGEWRAPDAWEVDA